MSSNRFCDLFCSKIELNWCSLTIENYVVLVQEVLDNENIPDGNLVCFQLFCSIMSEAINNNVFEREYKELGVFLQCVRHCKKVHKFDCYEFIDQLLNHFSTLPIELVWWLDKNDIMCFSQYCKLYKPIDLAITLLNKWKCKKQHQIFIAEDIVQDLIIDLIQGSFNAKIGFSHISAMIVWSTFCLQVLDDLINATLNDIFQETNNSFIEMFSFPQNSIKYLPSKIIEMFYQNILERVMTYRLDNFNLYSSYTYQELWCSKNMKPTLLMLYEKIFSHHCNIQNIFEIIENQGSNVNWKYTLAAVAVCIRKSKNASITTIIKVYVTETALNHLNESFRGGIVTEFIKAMLYIRQGCMEKSMNTNYSIWYSKMFGISSNFITTQNASLFTFVMNSLIRLIPFEPKAYLKLHMSVPMSAPPNCGSLIYDYKKLCGARLYELRKSPCISLNNVETTVLQIIEESTNQDGIGPLLKQIIHNQPQIFYDKIVPQVLRNKIPFKQIKQLLIQENYLTNEIIQFSHVDTDVVFDEDDDLIIIN